MKEEEIQRLKNYDKMKEAIEKDYDSTIEQMKKLKAKGKIKSVTYRQLTAKKLSYKNILNMYFVYGIIDKEVEDND